MTFWSCNTPVNILHPALILTFRTTTAPFSSSPLLIESTALSSLCQNSTQRLPLLYLVCFSDKLLPELRVGQWCKDMNRERHIFIYFCQNRNESWQVKAYQGWAVFIIARREGVTPRRILSSHLSQVMGMGEIRASTCGGWV